VLFVTADRVTLRKQEPELVDPVDKAMAGEGLDRKRRN
jgi:hypothetical protein